MPWETWVERRLREARETGAFEDLAGLGKPLVVRDHDAMTCMLTELNWPPVDGTRHGP